MNYNFSDYIIHNGNDLLPYLLWNIYSTLTSPTTRFLHFSYNKNDKFSNYNEIRKLRSQINGKSENYDLWKQYIIFSTKNSFIRTGSHRTLLRQEDFRPDCEFMFLDCCHPMQAQSLRDVSLQKQDHLIHKVEQKFRVQMCMQKSCVSSNSGFSCINPILACKSSGKL